MITVKEQIEVVRRRRENGCRCIHGSYEYADLPVKCDLCNSEDLLVELILKEPIGKELDEPTAKSIKSVAQEVDVSPSDLIAAAMQEASVLVTSSSSAIKSIAEELYDRRQALNYLNKYLMPLPAHYESVEEASAHAVQRCVIAEAKLAEVSASLKFYERREEHFAKALGVADKGTFRADWDGKLKTLLAERDAFLETIHLALGIQNVTLESCQKYIETMKKQQED